MLIEFSVENYLCFKNETTFSFEAMTDLDKSKIFNPESRPELKGVVDPETGKPLRINTVNAIYGKNAAGKSTFLRAIYQIFSLIMNSRKLNEDDDFNFEYFDDTLPAKFSLKFLQNNEVYAYQVHLSGQDTEVCIVFEQLVNESKKNILFTREYQTVTSDEFLHETQKDVLENDLQKNHLVLSQPFSVFNDLRETFSNKNNDFMDVRIIKSKDPFETLRYASILDIGLFPKKLKDKLESDKFKKDLLTHLKEADFDILDYEFILFEENLFDVYFTTRNGNKRTFREQSDGTKKFFILLIDIQDSILDNGGMYVVDELEKSLHPKLALRFIEIFKNPETNPNNARLLFTSHDVGFMHQSILNGDQVWFIDRNDETQETELFAAADVEGFEPVYLQSDYMQGLYGAVPTTANENK
jgi:AAA15 family ATPase/GTPase